ncbi:lipocalin family protein [Flavobacterium sp. I3-2]|uniref:lipocalin family protein n=1 Tax=Flavobacterium sp. I3-2 TaxID=2748319 RepID=UPI0015AB8242|nr:lipocalin family protein [Flavobacterium sp. I3-2]
MKKMFLSAVVLMISATALLSCSDDDNNSGVTSNQLNGKWNNLREEALDANGNIVETYIFENGSCPLDINEFKDNGVFVFTEYDYSTNASDCNEEISNGTWSLVDNNFKLNQGGEEFNFQVVKLNATEFEIQKPLSSEDAEDYELNVVTLRYVFKKI